MHNQTLTPAIEAALDNLRQAIAQELHHPQTAQDSNVSSAPVIGDISAPDVPVAPQTPQVADIPVMPASSVTDLSGTDMSAETSLPTPTPEPSSMPTPATPPSPDFVMPGAVAGSDTMSAPAGDTASAFVLPDLHAAPSSANDLPTPDMPAPSMSTPTTPDLGSTQLPDLPDLHQSTPADESASTFTPPAPAVGFGTTGNDAGATIPTPPAPNDIQIPPMSSTETSANPAPDNDVTQQPAANGLSKANGLLSNVLKKGWGNKQ